jgi:hypothetical protein
LKKNVVIGIEPQLKGYGKDELKINYRL